MPAEQMSFNKSSAVAEMAAQCCTSRIFAIEWVLLFNTFFFSTISYQIFKVMRSKVKDIGNGEVRH